jgi:hypothetical protein
MHRSLKSLDLEFPGSLSRMAPRVMLDEDFCLPVSAPLSALMPAPSGGHEPIVLHPLDEETPRQREPHSSRRSRPQPLPFVPFQPEAFLAKTPWSVHSVSDLIRLFLPEISTAIALMAGCGLMAGKLLARWTGAIKPLWVLGLYLAILLLHLGGIYLTNKGMNSSPLKASLRNLVIGLFFLLLPHTVAYLFLTVGG